jgi:molybdopterin-guanine dinucleotide biosynthesis protein A
VARDDVTGVLLVGGASRRFGAPKALARLGGETLAERAHRTLTDVFATVIVLGKARDALPLTLPVLDDGSDVRAPIAGVVAALQLAPHELVVIVPTDMPLVTADMLVELAAAADGVDVDVACFDTGPLPGAYRRSAAAVLERRLTAGELALRPALAELRTRVLPGDPALLRNVNTRKDLELVSD